jgi:membrane-associated phospholipid phosphatase
MFGKLCVFLLSGSLVCQQLCAQNAEMLAVNDSLKGSESLLASVVPSSLSETAGIDGDTTKKSVPTGVPVVDSFIGDFKTPVKPKPMSFKSVAIPLGMIAYGVFAVSNNSLKKANLFMREQLVEERGNNFRRIGVDDYTILMPAVAVYALNLAGIKGKNNFVDRSILFGMSNLIANGVVFSTKSLTGVIRPDSSNNQSFPSGHTSAAFVSAEFLRQEYKDVSPWIGVAGYAVATATGVLRMYNNKHWLNDVIAGAGVGILSVRLSYWLYPKIKNTILHKTGSSGTSTVVLPTYQNGMPGIGLVHHF